MLLENQASAFAAMPQIKPLEWDRRSEGLSACRFLGMVYTLTSHHGPYSLKCAGRTLYEGDDREEALRAAHNHAQAAVSGVLKGAKR